MRRIDFTPEIRRRAKSLVPKSKDAPPQRSRRNMFAVRASARITAAHSPLPMKFCILSVLAVISTAATAQQAPPKPQPAPPTDLEWLLQHPILPPKLTVLEAQAYCEPKVPRMPQVKSLAEWQAFADQTRRDVLDKIVFRGALPKQWRDAQT